MNDINVYVDWDISKQIIRIIFECTKVHHILYEYNISDLKDLLWSYSAKQNGYQ